jgi:putative SOS response-associated peptidase YedK
VDNFYDWKKTEIGKQPYAIALADRRLMALAGLCENWRSPAGELGAQLRHHHDRTERSMRPASQPHAGGP